MNMYGHKGSRCLAGLVLMLLLTGVSYGELICIQKPFDEYGKVPNTAAGICAAVATINSFVYLENHYQEIYPGQMLTGGDPVGARDKLAGGWVSPGGDQRQGIYGTPANPNPNAGTAAEIWKYKLLWLEDFAPGTTIVDGQVYRGGAGFGGWYEPDPLEDKYPEWGFLWDELKACEDIELGILPVDSGDGHAITLTSMCFNDLDDDKEWDPSTETAQIDYADPNQFVPGALDHNGDPAYDLDNPKVAPITYNAATGRLEFTWWQTGTPYYVYRAYTESPVPEPSTIVGLLSMTVMGLVIYRRRRKRAA